MITDDHIKTNVIPDNYIANRLVELCNGKNTLDEISEIISSERSLEKVFLFEDLENYIQQWRNYGFISDINGYPTIDDEILSSVIERNGNRNNIGLTRVLWDITRKCNLKCSHCYAHKDGNGGELTTEECINTLHDLKKLHPYLIVFGGGEPILRKDFLEILQKTKEILNCRVKILTNGTLITEDIVKAIKPYVDFMQFSIDGKKENHEKLRNKKGCHGKAIDAIQLTRYHGIHVGICMTLHKYNIEDIDWVVDFAVKNNVYKIRISPFVAAGKAISSYKDWNIPREKMKGLYASLFELRKKYRNQLLFDFRDELYGNAFLTTCLADKREAHQDYLLCAAGRSLFYINPEGFVTPCNFIDVPAYFLGNVKEDSLADIWNTHSILEEFRGLSVDDIDRCSICNNKGLCGGGLRCNALSLRNNVRAADPLCCFFERTEHNVKNIDSK